MKEEAINHWGRDATDYGDGRQGGRFRFRLDCGDFFNAISRIFFPPSRRKKDNTRALEILECIGLLFIVINRDWKRYGQKKYRVRDTASPIPSPPLPPQPEAVLCLVDVYFYFNDPAYIDGAEIRIVIITEKNRLMRASSPPPGKSKRMNASAAATSYTRYIIIVVYRARKRWIRPARAGRDPDVYKFFRDIPGHLRW